jgi:hypothetical protein
MGANGKPNSGRTLGLSTQEVHMSDRSMFAGRCLVAVSFCLAACGVPQAGSETTQEDLSAESAELNASTVLANKSLRLIEEYIDAVWVPHAGATLAQRQQAFDLYISDTAQMANLAAQPLAPVPARVVLKAILGSVVAMDPNTTIRSARSPRVWVLKDGTTRVTSWTTISGTNVNGYDVPNFGFVPGNNKHFSTEQEFVYTLAFPVNGPPVITGMVGDTDFADFLKDLGAIP